MLPSDPNRMRSLLSSSSSSRPSRNNINEALRLGDEDRVSMFHLHPGPTNNRNNWSGSIEFRIEGTELFDVSLPRIQRGLVDVFDRLIRYGRLAAGLGPDDRFQIVLRDLNSGIYSHTRYASDITGAETLDKIAEVVQSNDLFDIEQSIVSFVYTKRSLGGGYFDTALSIQEFIRKKTYIVGIDSVNNNCFFQCIVLGLAQLNSDQSYYKTLLKKKNGVRKKLNNESELVYKYSTKGVSLKQIKNFEEYYEIKIIIVDLESSKVIYQGSKKHEKYMCFGYVSNPDNETDIHYYYINRFHIGSLWAKRKFCFKCYKGYKDLKHRCIEKCRACKRDTCHGTGKSSWRGLLCQQCNQQFFDKECFDYHILRLCSKEKRCPICSLVFTVDKKLNHECYKSKCRNCKALIPHDTIHKCFHQKLIAEELKPPKYIYYDYETCLNSNFEHEVVLIVAMYNNTDEIKVFSVHDEFITWLFNVTHKGYTVIAHNSGRYDFHFIKREMLKRKIKSEDICNGHSIFYSYCPKFKLRFIDSYKLIPIGLRQFPKSFGIKELKKGFFPYRYMSLDNLHEVIYELPSIETFEFSKMKSKEMEEGKQWYIDNKQFNEGTTIFQICRDYCISDVKLLKEGCLVFEKMFLEISNNTINPFDSVTIAACCMKLYRTLFLPQDTIGVFPGERIDFQRKLAIMSQFHETRLTNNSCILPDREIELLNCLDHGCPQCFSKWKIHPVFHRKMYELYYKWQNTPRGLYTGIWECEFFKAYPNVDVFVKQIIMNDAFYGGRTEPFKYYYKCQGNEKIHYLDYTSLYPSTQSGAYRQLYDGQYLEETTRPVEYPVGHPVYLYDKKDFAAWKTKFGLIKCRVTCPKDLYLPLLPEKKNGKLMFDLTDKIGTWTTIEMLKAVELGYVIEEIYGIIHFENRSTDLFRDYVNTFIAKKIEAGGKEKFPSDEELDTFIEECLQQGIKIDKSKFSKNPGLYFVVKLCLNSLWGKYAQRQQYKNVIDVFSLSEFEAIAENDECKILEVILLGPVARSVTYETKADFVNSPPHTNIMIAIFTTAHARLRLYEAMEVVGKGMLYCDTDSLIFVDDGSCPLQCGPHLGDLTDELESGDWIIEFVSSGPKSYAYRTNNGKVCCKIKGITLNHINSLKLNFESLKRLICDGRSEELITESLQFKIQKNHQIFTDDVNNKKVFRFTGNKRKIINSDDPNKIDTAPFI